MKMELSLGNSMQNFNKYYLDFNTTFLYVTNHLENGKSLSQTILNNCDFKKGEFYTILPSNANLNALYLFENGGIIPQEEEKKLIDFHGSNVWYQGLTSTDDWTAEYLYNSITIDKEKIVVLQDFMREKKDNLTKIGNIQISYLKEEVYYLLNCNNSFDEVTKATKRASYPWQFVGLLTKPQIAFSEILTLEEMQKFVMYMQTMFVTAYDGESFIFWEKSHSCSK